MTIETNKKNNKRESLNWFEWICERRFASRIDGMTERKKEKVYLQNNVTFNEMKWNEMKNFDNFSFGLLFSIYLHIDFRYIFYSMCAFLCWESYRPQLWHPPTYTLVLMWYKKIGERVNSNWNLLWKERRENKTKKSISIQYLALLFNLALR